MFLFFFFVFLSCIERWLKDPKNKCCPQCKTPARRKDIRNIFAKSLKALDTTEKEELVFNILFFVFDVGLTFVSIISMYFLL